MSEKKKFPEKEWADLGPANAALSLFGKGEVQCIMITGDYNDIDKTIINQLKDQFGFKEIPLPEAPEALSLISVKYTDRQSKKINLQAIPYKEIAQLFEGAEIRQVPMNELFQLWDGLEHTNRDLIVSTASSKRTARALLSNEYIGMNEKGHEIYITPDEQRFYKEGEHLIFSNKLFSDSAFLKYNLDKREHLDQAARDLLKESEITEKLLDIHRIDKAIEFGAIQIRMSSDRAAILQAQLCHSVKATYLIDVQRSLNQQEIPLEKLSEINDIIASLPTPTRRNETPLLAPALGYVTRKYLEAVDKCNSLTILNAATLGANVFTPSQLPLKLIDPQHKLNHPQYQGLCEEFGNIPYTERPVSSLVSMRAENILFSSEKAELKEAVDQGGISVKRQDHHELLHTLKIMPNDASGVFIIGADDGFNLGAVDLASYDVHNYIFKNYNVLDTADVAPIISGTNNPETAKRIYIINGRRDIPTTTNAPTEVNSLYSINDLFAFSNELPAKFSDQLSLSVKDAHELLTTTSISDILATYTSNQRDSAKYDLNFLQSRYTPLTSIATANDMSAMPTSFVHASREAIIKLVRDVGNPDQFIMKELGMSAEQLADVFDAEQIDAITMGIWRLKNGKPFLQSDAAGKGKGRTIAAMMAWSIRNGHPPIFMTSKSDLLSDIYRDIRDIGMEDVINPLIIASDTMEIVDKRENTVLVSKDSIKEAANSQLSRKNHTLSSEYNCILTTYSQLNQLKKSRKAVPLTMLMSDKAKWVLEYTKSHNPQFIIDESHNIATHDTNRGKVIELITGKSNRPIVRASATWAKNAKNIAQCADLFPAEYTQDVLKKMVTRGGTSLQEVLSTTLIAEGAMVRRDHNFGKRQVSVVQSHETQRNRQATDKMSMIMQKGLNYTKAQYENYKKRFLKTDLGQRTNDIEQFSFASSFSLIADAFTNSMRASAVANLAVESVMNQQKPVIGVDKTGESALKFLYEAIKEEGSDKVILDEFPDFKALMHRWVIQQGKREYKVVIEPTLEEIRIAAREGTVAEPTIEKFVVSWREELDKGSVEYQELEALEKDLIKSLDSLPDLPLSPIDFVKTELAKNEITTSEVSGRQLHTRLHQDGKRYVIEPRAKETKAEAQFAFNSNKTDAIIITRSGTEGISLHADEKLTKYGESALNQRHTILMGSFMNIVDEEQFFGRSERKGQVKKALSSKVVTGMPIEARALSLSERNRLRLSASTTGTTKSLRATNTMPNLLNPFGDNVVAEYLSMNDSVIDLLGFTEAKKEVFLNYGSDAVKSTEISSTAGSVLGRMMLLDYNQQNALLDDITSFYNTKLSSLQARGLDPINTRNIQGTLEIKAEERITGAVKEHYESEFDKPVLVQSVTVTSPPVTIDIQSIQSNINLGQKQLDSVLNKKNATLGDLSLHIMSKKNEVLEHALSRHNSIAAYLKRSAHYVSVPDALACDKSNDIKNLNENFKELVSLFSTLKLGNVYEDIYNKNNSMIISGITVPKRPEDLLNEWEYSIGITSTSGDLNRMLSPSTFISLMSGDTKETLNATDMGPFSESHSVCEKFEMLKLEGPSEPAVIITGNMVEASRINAEALLGSHVTFVDKKTNTIIPAIKAKRDLSMRDVINKRFGASNVEIESLKSAFNYNLLNNQIFIFEHRSAKPSDGGKTEGNFFFGKDNKFKIILPRTKSGAMSLGVPDPFDGKECDRSKPNARSGCSRKFEFENEGDLDFVMDKLIQANFIMKMSTYEIQRIEQAIDKINNTNSPKNIKEDVDIEDAILMTGETESFEESMVNANAEEAPTSQVNATLDSTSSNETLSTPNNSNHDLDTSSVVKTETDQEILDEILGAVKQPETASENHSTESATASESLMSELESKPEDDDEIVNLFSSPM